MKNYHITKNDSGWQLKAEGANRASISAETKQQIVKVTREFMKNKIGSVKIHKVDGSFQEERTYQRKDDPKKTKG